jgi:DNA-binding NarL/FixJ family response regulator
MRAQLFRRPEVLLQGPFDESRISDAIHLRTCDVLLIDAPSCGSRAVAILRRVAALSPGLKVLMFYPTCTDARVDYILHCGGAGCVPTDACAFELIRAIQAVDAGELWASRKLMARAIRTLHGPSDIRSLGGLQNQLSARERQVVEWMRTGMSNKEIARELGISDMTVKTHAQNIFHKLEINGRLHLMALG